MTIWANGRNYLPPFHKMKNILIYIVLIFLFLYSLILISTIRKQNTEINKLRYRVKNLEIVVNYEKSEPTKKLAKGDFKI